jgi:hypothetical protein
VTARALSVSDLPLCLLVQVVIAALLTGVLLHLASSHHHAHTPETSTGTSTSTNPVHGAQASP